MNEHSVVDQDKRHSMVKHCRTKGKKSNVVLELNVNICSFIRLSVGHPSCKR
jgi:hypothetical protein